MTEIEQPGRIHPDLRLMNGEMWLARRLSRFGVLCGTFEGVTDSAERKRRLRQVIIDRGLEQIRIIDPAPTPKPRTITYAAAFERLYGEPL